MRVTRITDFIEENEQVEWLIDKLLPNVGWTLLYGQQGLGKTTLAMQMCAALQLGQDFLGRKVQQTKVLYIQADSVTSEWREMLKRIAPKSKGYTVVDVPAKCLGTPNYVVWLTNAVDKVNPGFVVFDSLYNLTAWPISTDSGILTCVNFMKGIANGRPWLLIHHPPHAENRAAGHHSLAANCSNEWSLLKTKLKIEKGRLVSDKEILITRDSKGLWELYKKDSDESADYSNLTNVRI